MIDYQFTKTSLKHFQKLPREIQARIIEKLDYYCNQENPLDFAEPLSDKHVGSYRFRVGDYRVSFDVENNNLVIHDVGHRKDIYR